MSLRIGIGYDVHRLVPERKLIIGGVDIPYEKGLLGHSDADVLGHAVIDALLGAAALGDIGKHFPDTSADYKDISSLTLLTKTAVLLADKGYGIVNVDTIIIAERPKLLAFHEDMKTNIAKSLDISPDVVNIKATTEEGLGFTGRGEGIAAKAVCLLEVMN